MPVISASRRCDIPAFQSTWLMNRLEAGFTTLPGYRTRAGNTVPERRVSLSPDDVDCIVLWTKDIRRMLRGHDLERMREMGHSFYIQHTLTAYGTDIEPALGGAKNDILDAMREVTATFGADALVWRYDPILMTEDWDVKRHLAAFEHLAEALEGSTDTCIVSFLDVYGKLEQRLATSGIAAPSTEDIDRLMPKMAEIARAHGMRLQTCAEARDLSRWGIEHAHCVDAERIERVCGHPVDATKDRSQRRVCGCVRSIDIGAYNTCGHMCRYCYANSTPAEVRRMMSTLDPASDLACGMTRRRDRS